MDNDEAGARTKAELDKFFQTQDMVHRPQNARYADFKDVNEHHIAQVKRHIVKLKLGE
jgi:hypothetical protein